MILFLFLGASILQLFGIDVQSFAVAGAIIMFIISLEMILGVTIWQHDTASGGTTSVVPIAFPLIAGAGTLTTIAAFAPMLIALDGGKSEYVYSLPVTVSTTLALSWILAMTFCVVLAAIFIRPPKEGRPGSPVLALFARRAASGKSGNIKLLEIADLIATSIDRNVKDASGGCLRSSST